MQSSRCVQCLSVGDRGGRPHTETQSIEVHLRLVNRNTHGAVEVERAQMTPLACHDGSFERTEFVKDSLHRLEVDDLKWPSTGVCDSPHVRPQCVRFAVARSMQEEPVERGVKTTVQDGPQATFGGVDLT